MKIRIEPYKTWSGGAKALGNYLGVLRATRRQVEKHGDFDIIINWGRTERRFNGQYLNDPEAVSRACSKLSAAEAFKEAGVSQPDFTTDKAIALEWWEDGLDVVARTLLRANSGRGIVLCGKERGVEVPNAPLYTQYVKKADEFRVHIFGGEVIDVQQKRKRQEVPNEDVDYQIRNARNGWVYCRGGVNAPPAVLESGLAAVRCLGLDFGAADIGYNRHKETAVVFEVNTAPGLEGSTLEAYSSALRARYNALDGGMYCRRRAGQNPA